MAIGDINRIKFRILYFILIIILLDDAVINRLISINYYLYNIGQARSYFIYQLFSTLLHANVDTKERTILLKLIRRRNRGEGCL